jgi:hypothetical protein
VRAANSCLFPYSLFASKVEDGLATDLIRSCTTQNPTCVDKQQNVQLLHYLIVHLS